jgi:hypothetical protein
MAAAPPTSSVAPVTGATGNGCAMATCPLLDGEWIEE